MSYPYGPRATPTVDGNRVYTLGAAGNLLCLDVVDGDVLWEVDLPQRYKCSIPTWGFAGHPLVDEERLICLVGGEGSVAVALDKHSGTELWRALSARESGYCPPTIIEWGKTRQLLIWHPESLNSLNPRTGAVYWSEKLKPSWGMSIATPRRDGPYLFTGGNTNQSLLLRLEDDRPAVEFVWSGRKDRGLGPAFATPFMENGYLYGIDLGGELRCAEVKTGQQLWDTLAVTNLQRRKNNASAFLVKHEDRFFIFNDQGELIIADLNPQGYREISRAQILQPLTRAEGRLVIWSHPAFAMRSIFARNDTTLVRYSLAE
jgi:outer membrane protein assembly factor BamB